jgi:23S rRNA (adenine-N6)-dimethyltransferase
VRNTVKYSQNFLTNDELVASLLSKSSISNTDTVLEIGVGDGIITKKLLRKSERVVAFEIDKNKFDKASLLFQAERSLDLVWGDFLTFRLPSYQYKVFSNIPFNITSSIIKKLFFDDYPPEDAYLIIQKEAALKFVGKPLNNKNSQLSVILYPWFEMSITHNFKKNDFSPKPKVDIVLLEIYKRKIPLIGGEKEKYFDFVTYTFNQFKPNIGEGLREVFGGKELFQIAKRLGFSLESKPSDLDFENWISLFEIYLNIPEDKQRVIFGSYTKQLMQQQGLEKIHRTRTDPNWRKG